MLKQTLTRLREKSQGDFKGNKIGTLRSFYSSYGEISAHQLIVCGDFTLFLPRLFGNYTFCNFFLKIRLLIIKKLDV